jgi:hypothetical protein
LDEHCIRVSNKGLVVDPQGVLLMKNSHFKHGRLFVRADGFSVVILTVMIDNRLGVNVLKYGRVLVRSDSSSQSCPGPPPLFLGGDAAAVGLVGENSRCDMFCTAVSYENHPRFTAGDFLTCMRVC